MDKTIEPGGDWPREIRTALENAQTVLVIVVDWDKWLAVQKRGKRRIDNPKDWVRQEIFTALSGNKQVIPVLIDPNVDMILPEDLPDDIRQLTDKQKFCIRKDAWDQDLKQLVNRFFPEPAISGFAAAPVASLSSADIAARCLADACGARANQHRTLLAPARPDAALDAGDGFRLLAALPG